MSAEDLAGAMCVGAGQVIMATGVGEVYRDGQSRQDVTVEHVTERHLPSLMMQATTVTKPGRLVSVHETLRRTPRAELARLTDALDRFPGVLDDPCVATRLLEEEVSRRLGKPSAVFLPTGKMAQQIALRIHADKRPCRRTVVAHGTNHLSLWEDENYARLHDLHVRTAGDRYRLLSVEDIEQAAGASDVAAVLWELPQRELGGELPDWSELTAQLSVAAESGAATHLDGARVWQCEPHYGRTLTAICAGFDSVYVSLYKDLEAPRGALLAGDEGFIAKARVWQHRMGGTIDGAWPLALLALDGVHRVMDAMPGYVRHAQALAVEIAATTPATIRPAPPQTAMFHVHLPVPVEAARSAHEELVQAGGLRLTLGMRSGPDPTSSWCELTVGEDALRYTPRRVADAVNQLVALAETPATPVGAVSHTRPTRPAASPPDTEEQVP